MGKGQQKKLDSDTLKEITSYVIAKLREEENNTAKFRYDKRRANTKMLLRNYRSLADHCESAIYDASQADDDTSLADVLELLGGSRAASLKVESIKESAARTRLIVDHITKMLELYRAFCEHSTRPEDMRRYRVITHMYFSRYPKTAEELAAIESVEARTVYRDVDAAVERLTALIFGIDGLYLQEIRHVNFNPRSHV
jgi:hypothetical protein